MRKTCPRLTTADHGCSGAITRSSIAETGSRALMQKSPSLLAQPIGARKGAYCLRPNIVTRIAGAISQPVMASDQDRSRCFESDCLKRMRTIRDGDEHIHLSAQIDEIAAGLSLLLPGKGAVGADTHGREERQRRGNITAV